MHKNHEGAKIFMFLKLSYFKIGLIFEKAELFGKSWISCEHFKIWMVSPAYAEVVKIQRGVSSLNDLKGFTITFKGRIICTKTLIF